MPWSASCATSATWSPCLRNFVTLSDFYGRQNKAIFQAGTLYLDQRSCELVMRVTDMAKHATLAPFSGCYLVYCSCVRAGCEPMSIVAALTGGEVDELMVPGRNGIFYDRDGRDWKATVVKVVEQPVSIRQAFWSPYRRLGALIENQIRKFAASRDKDVESKTAANVTEVAAKVEGGQAAPRAVRHRQVRRYFRGNRPRHRRDRNRAGGGGHRLVLAGVVATAIVAIAVMLIISGPSMLLAYMTLRRRNLGPLLDANGWA
jgi:hypothetical protein